MIRSATLRPLAWCALPAVAGILALSLSGRAADLVLINESPSLPKGLYVRTLGASPARGAIVALAQPEAVRPYLSRLGMPSDVRLIKRVAGMPGDPVCARNERLLVGSRDLPVLADDRRGAALPRWSGCRALRADEYFLLGDTPTSFDSRYFGPANRADLIGVYRSLLTW